MGAAAPFVMAFGSALLQSAFSVMQAKQEANAQYKMASIQAKQAVQQANAQYQEVDRQQREVNRVAEEQRSDRMRMARQELGTLRVIAGERGAAGSLEDALSREVGYFAGLDLSRIEANRKADIDAGEAAKKSAQQGALNTIDIAKNTVKTARKGYKNSILGAGVQIAGAAVSSYADYSTSQSPSPQTVPAYKQPSFRPPGIY